MPFCAIKLCGNNSKTSNTTTNNITFHRFPKDPDRKSKWIDVTKRENWFPSQFSVICSKHFAEDCFVTTTNKSRRLMSSALPTLFLPRTVDIPDEIDSKLLGEKASDVASTSDEYVLPAGLTTPHETPSQFNSVVTKKLHRRVIEMSEKLKYKNKQIKNLRGKNRYLKKKIGFLKTMIKNLISTEKANMET